MKRSPSFPSLGRRTLLGVAVTSALALTGCPDSTWVVRRELASVRMPHDIVIMVWKSPRVRERDVEGHTDVVVVAVREELESRGLAPTVTDLEGKPRLPRIELVFWTPPSETVGTGRIGQGAITVDCAFVSGRDEVQFVGRVQGYGKDGDLVAGAQAIAKAIADALLHS